LIDNSSNNNNNSNNNSNNDKNNNQQRTSSSRSLPVDEHQEAGMQMVARNLPQTTSLQALTLLHLYRTCSLPADLTSCHARMPVSQQDQHLNIN
jgi:hypothetical protein